MAPHSSTLAWKIPWMEEPGRVQIWLSDFTFTFHFHALEKEMATHSSVLAWRIPGLVGPDGLPFNGVAQSRTRLKWLSSSSSSCSFPYHNMLFTITCCLCYQWWPLAWPKNFKLNLWETAFTTIPRNQPRHTSFVRKKKTLLFYFTSVHPFKSSAKP